MGLIAKNTISDNILETQTVSGNDKRQVITVIVRLK